MPIENVKVGQLLFRQRKCRITCLPYFVVMSDIIQYSPQFANPDSKHILTQLASVVTFDVTYITILFWHFRSCLTLLPYSRCHYDVYVVALLVMSAMSIVCPKKIVFKPNIFSNEIVCINVAYVHKSQFCSICNFSLAIWASIGGRIVRVHFHIGHYAIRGKFMPVCFRCEKLTPTLILMLLLVIIESCNRNKCKFCSSFNSFPSGMAYFNSGHYEPIY